VVSEHQGRILNYLLHAQAPVSASLLASSFGLSSRTVRNQLRELDGILRQNGALLKKLPGIGYQLVEEQPSLFAKYLDQEKDQLSSKVRFSLTQERVFLILRTLLAADEYIKIDQLQDILYLNRTSISALLQLVKKELSSFSLTLVSKPHFGLAIMGAEHDLRTFINYQLELYYLLGEEETQAELFVKRYGTPPAIYQKLRDMVIELADRYTKNNLSTHSIQQLVCWIWISQVRNRLHHDLTYPQDIMDEFTMRNSYYTAKEIWEAGQRITGYGYSKSDIVGLAIHIVSNRVVLSQADYPFVDEYVKIRDLSFELVKHLGEINHFHFIGKDLELIDAISLNLLQMLRRTRFHIRSCFDYTNSSYAIMALKLAMQAACYLKELLDITLNPEEIYYLSHIIHPVFGRFPFQYKKLPTVVVSDINKSAGEAIAQRLRRNFSNHLGEITVLDQHELTAKVLSQCRVLFVTQNVLLPENLPLNLLVEKVDLFFDEKRKMELRHTLVTLATVEMNFGYKFVEGKNLFRLAKVKDKKDCLKQLAACLIERQLADERVLADLWQSESLYPCRDYNNTVFLSPLNFHHQETVICVFTLPRAIIYNTRKVQILVYMDQGSQKENAGAFESEAIPHLLSYVFSDEKVNQLLLAPKDCVDLSVALNQALDEILVNGKSFR